MATIVAASAARWSVEQVRAALVVDRHRRQAGLDPLDPFPAASGSSVSVGRRVILAPA
ncbi:hypothetical protein FMEAI12_1830031 [Parafrankia sp. Ea1.12]|nr:hypothetical protein FMEAI12_1830031 [Parafrankia sp. Ea1.12]